MPVVSKLAAGSPRKRLIGVVIVASLCTLMNACGNDDKPADTTAASQGSTGSTADSSNAQASAQANALATSPVPGAVVMIQTPASPAPGADTALSDAASTPLATPVIHTVD